MALIDSTPVSLVAGADLSARLYRFGKINSSGRVVACSVAGERADVIIASKPTANGDPVDGWCERAPKVEAGAAITAGDSLTTDNVGRAVTATAGQVVNAIALESAGAAGKFIQVLRPLAHAVNANEQAVSASGALNPTASHISLSVDGTKAYTLAAGVVGAEIEIDCIAAINTPLGTLTIADTFGTESLTHVFTAAGQGLRLRMLSDGWKVVEKRRVGARTVVVGTDELTGHDMVDTYNLSVTGAVSSTAAANRNIPPGQVDGEVIWVRVTTAASTPNGSIEVTAKTLGGAAATALSVIDATTDYAQFRWDGAAWQNQLLNSMTLS